MHLSESSIGYFKIAKPLVKVISGRRRRMIGGYVRYKTLVPALLKSINTGNLDLLKKTMLKSSFDIAISKNLVLFYNKLQYLSDISKL
jgi:hypothetical protein